MVKYETSTRWVNLLSDPKKPTEFLKALDELSPSLRERNNINNMVRGINNTVKVLGGKGQTEETIEAITKNIVDSITFLKAAGKSASEVVNVAPKQWAPAVFIN